MGGPIDMEQNRCESIGCYRATLWLSTVTSPMTLTLDFEGQFLKNLLLRNGMPNWHGTKGMWVAWMLDPCYDFQLWPHPWPLPRIFNVKFWNSSSFDLDPEFSSGCGLGTFLSWWPPSTMWVGPSIFYGHHRGCLNSPIFSNLGVMCCMLRTFYVSSQIVANISKSPLLFSQ